MFSVKKNEDWIFTRLMNISWVYKLKRFLNLSSNIFCCMKKIEKVELIWKRGENKWKTVW